MNKALQNYECEGQIDLFDYLKTLPADKQPVTKYTCTIIGKECKAHSYKGCSIPGKCELLKQAVIGNNPEPKEPEPFMNPPEEPIYELDIVGICDDPVCPKCGYEFETTRTCKNYEVDCERCPECHIKVDWTRWHRLND